MSNPSLFGVVPLPVCYNLRLRSCAGQARKNGIGYFTTTLLSSPYQLHELVKETGERVSADTGVEFVYRDFRPVFYEGKT
jgi:predicted adenine nucleotide alpha hydrolase (AANH) superfamily ATPase